MSIMTMIQFLGEVFNIQFKLSYIMFFVKYVQLRSLE